VLWETPIKALSSPTILLATFMEKKKSYPMAFGGLGGFLVGCFAVLLRKTCKKGRFAKDTKGEGREDLELTYHAHVLIWDLLLRYWDKFMTDLWFW